MKKFFLIGGIILLAIVSVLSYRYYRYEKFGGDPYAEMMDISPPPLSIQELERLKKEVKEGNAEAALKISSHYSFSLHDPTQGMIWLKKAVNLGDEESKGVLYETAEMMGLRVEDIPEPDLE